ncbi:phospho-sugar mutase [Microcella humidisoli]|jgi:phosphomannomutase|uniref:Phospho-sugar mutase n=1 Tax=Microcella humidisoli TaxID=2963406 RepID=A0ABY5FY47_9MICO|nr:phospho-sugar mutase [Microcella humidisoli]UTT63052.1 phospho-sugar mutase [Microcella humidisoli]
MTTLDLAKSWLEQDPDPVTRAELEALIPAAEGGDAAAMDALRDRFDTRLTFGTAGLRGELGAGPNRMNRVLVSQAATGFARWLLARDENASVVIGYDGRVNSDVFARDSAELMAGAGVRVVLLPRALPTPVLAFAVRELGLSAGVMVTASHNPPRDNGYKVYLGGRDGGSQIVAPADEAIHAAILEVANTSVVGELPRSSAYETADESIIDAYIARTAALVTHTPESAVLEPVSFVYTAMHGVGWEVAQRVFRDAGLGEPTVVAEQIAPDGAFPTVAFPNPEEPGAMDLSFATARAAGAELIIANDPDADRLAVAIPDASTPEGWRRLSGNAVGALLGWRAAERLEREGRQAKFAASLVSSPALSAVAAAYGVSYSDTLTGFKWISRVGGLGYGYEEALGYLVDPEKVRDKDGISAAVDFLALAGELKAAGRTLDDHQRDFDERFGAFASAQVSLRVTDLSRIGAIMAALRDNPPNEVGGVRVEQVDDFIGGFGVFPPGDILRFWMRGGARVIVRPSGTEPKVKVYIDASSTTGSVDERRAAAQAEVAALEAGMRALIV